MLAAVTVGVWLGWQASELTTHTTRLQLNAIWETLQFVLNALLFVLIGLQLPLALEGLEQSPASLLGYGALIGVTVIVVRLVWVFGLAAVPRKLSGVRGGQPLRLRDEGVTFDADFADQALRLNAADLAALVDEPEYPQRQVSSAQCPQSNGRGSCPRR